LVDRDDETTQPNFPQTHSENESVISEGTMETMELEAQSTVDSDSCLKSQTSAVCHDGTLFFYFFSSSCVLHYAIFSV